MNRRMNRRPQWARGLTVKNWKHLQEGQATKNPTLRAMKLDAATGDDCRWMLRCVEGGR